MLSVRERQLLRDRVAREALGRGLRNPLVTNREMEEENLDLLPNIVADFLSDPGTWHLRVRRVTTKTKVLSKNDLASSC